MSHSNEIQQHADYTVHTGTGTELIHRFSDSCLKC